MEVVALFCPKCGGKITLPEGKNSCFCGYCGSQLVVDDGSITVTYRSVDEARIRESDNEVSLELRKLEFEEAKHAHKMKVLKVLAIACAVLFVIALIIGVFDETTGLLLGSASVFIAIIGVLMFLADEQNKNEDDDEGVSNLKAKHKGGIKGGSIAAGVAAVAGLAIGLLWRK